MPAKIEYARLDLMGIGTPESERTAGQRRLATIILAGKVERIFEDRPDAHWLWRLQEYFFEQRHRFITTMDERRLRPLAASLLHNDRTLSRRATRSR